MTRLPPCRQVPEQEAEISLVTVYTVTVYSLGCILFALIASMSTYFVSIMSLITSALAPVPMRHVVYPLGFHFEIRIKYHGDIYPTVRIESKR
jgi:hypothetical protein